MAEALAPATDTASRHLGATRTPVEVLAVVIDSVSVVTGRPQRVVIVVDTDAYGAGPYADAFVPIEPPPPAPQI